MTTDGKNDGGTKGPRKRRAVKPVTIDLKATEVEADAAKAKAPEEKTAKADAPASKSEPGAAPKPEPKAAEAAQKPSAKPAPTKPAGGRGPAAVRADQETSTFPIVIAAIVGAGLALAIYFAVETTGMLPFGPTARVTELRGALDRAEARITALDRRQNEADNVGADQLASVESRVATLEAEANAGRDALGPVGLVGRLTALENGIGEGRDGVETLRRDLEALSARLEAIADADVAATEAGDASAESALDTARQESAQLAGRIAALEERVAAAASQADQLAALAGEVGTIRERLTNGAAGAEVAIATVKDELAAVSTKLEAAQIAANTATDRATAAIGAAENAAARAATDAQLRATFEAFAADTRVALAALAPLRAEIAKLNT
ncbi:MAG: hypothetical protein KDJ16_00235, partial [Hyphomicrobiales bacterium]|nr:hypothetical protein [Hyphomicrobiales bacterium]